MGDTATQGRLFPVRSRFLNRKPTGFTGLIPAAGQAKRLGRLPCSKELLPIEVRKDDAGGRLVTAIDRALDCFAACDVEAAHIIIRPEKSDIPAYVGDGSRNGLRVNYVTIEESGSVPESLDSAYPLVRGQNIVLLFPDILIDPPSILMELLQFHSANAPDVALALVPSTEGHKVDIVSIANDGAVRHVTPKPGRGIEGWTWVAATWGPRFSEWMHNELKQSTHAGPPDLEPYVGDYINQAIKAGLSVKSLCWPEGRATDIGTLDALEALWRPGV